MQCVAECIIDNVLLYNILLLRIMISCCVKETHIADRNREGDFPGLWPAGPWGRIRLREDGMRIFKKDDSGEFQDVSSELDELKETVQGSSMPPRVVEAALREVKRLTRMGPSTAEYTIGINYIDYLLSLPWQRMTEDHLDIKTAEEILDQEHYGLEEIKERILEYLAVRILKTSHKQRILVVDDERVTRLNLQHVLSKEGYEVVLAASGVEALGLLRKGAFDIIVTDLKMDRVDGMEVLKKAKEENPNTEVIIITGYATVPTAIDAMKKGSFHFLAKPLKLDEIRNTVKRALAGKMARLTSRGPVLCFVGPPGTGKTSLGRSIARSLHRKFVRISLAGMKDEAEIRGHRRSYVGALPGRIIQEVRRCGTRNPAFMLDELDKVGQDFKGDPASALLEVLDPEQNTHFMDHYLDVPFDLSRVMFIATANTTDNIPPPLLDRVEVLRLSGYTEQEKEEIAFRHLIPREIQEAGLQEHPPSFTREAVRKMILEYTREAGLRDLQRQAASICRKVARGMLGTEEAARKASTITPEAVEAFLGPRKYHFEVAEARDRVGVSTGLAWTETGGEIIFVEATTMRGRNRLILTGSLGDVMKESAQAALSYIRSHAGESGIEETFFDRHDIHVHVPAGAIPKDGPSAGLTIAVALLSLLTGRPCRRTVALSGELTLSGRVLPVGGIKEKLLAAGRGGVGKVVFPAKNDGDFRILGPEITRGLEIRLVDRVEDVLEEVLI